MVPDQRKRQRKLHTIIQKKNFVSCILKPETKKIHIGSDCNSGIKGCGGYYIRMY